MRPLPSQEKGNLLEKGGNSLLPEGRRKSKEIKNVWAKYTSLDGGSRWKPKRRRKRVRKDPKKKGLQEA